MLACYLVSDRLVLPYYLVMQLFRLECRNVCLIEGSFGFPFAFHGQCFEVFWFRTQNGITSLLKSKADFHAVQSCHEKEWQWWPMDKGRQWSALFNVKFLIFECWHLAKLMYRKFCPLKVLKVTLTENWPRTPSSQVGVCFGAFDFSCPAPLPDACWMGQRNFEGCSCLLVLPCANSHWWSHRPSQDKSWSETLNVYEASLKRDTTKKQSYDLASGKWITRTCARQLELATASFRGCFILCFLFCPLLRMVKPSL